MSFQSYVFSLSPQGDLYEGMVMDSEPIVAPKGASEMELRAKQLVKLLDNLEHHMIHELQRKIAKEHALVAAERARDEGKDPLEILRQESNQKKSRFDNPLNEVRAGQAAQATEQPADSLRAGQYIRRTLTLSPGQLRMLKRIADELGVSEAKTARWLIDIGISAFVEGKRPDRGYNVEEKDW